MNLSDHATKYFKVEDGDSYYLKKVDRKYAKTILSTIRTLIDVNEYRSLHQRIIFHEKLLMHDMGTLSRSERNNIIEDIEIFELIVPNHGIIWDHEVWQDPGPKLTREERLNNMCVNETPSHIIKARKDEFDKLQNLVYARVAPDAHIMVLDYPVTCICVDKKYYKQTQEIQEFKGKIGIYRND